MMAITFIRLPDIVLLEVFSYLSCEDLLYAFIDLRVYRLSHLLTERGAFRQICLSSPLSRLQYQILSQGIWRYDLVRSFICKEMFSDFITQLAPCAVFPSLTELRILFIRRVCNSLAPFIIAHADTLTHLILKRSEQSFIAENIPDLIQTVLPHLYRIQLLDTDLRVVPSIQWSRFANGLQSVERLITSVRTLSDVYALAAEGFLPCLQQLRVMVYQAVMKTTLPVVDVRLAHLKTFDLCLEQGGPTGDGERSAKWSDIENLLSSSVMPCLRRCSLIYFLSMYDDIEHIAQSSLFADHTRHLRIQFVFYDSPSVAGHSADRTSLCNIRFGSIADVLVNISEESTSKLRLAWLTSSVPSWTTCWIDHRDIAHRAAIRQLEIRASNVSLSTLNKLLAETTNLVLMHPASFSFDYLSMTKATTFTHLRRLVIHRVVPGLELLLDGHLLPALHYLYGLVVPLFVAFLHRSDPKKTLNTVEHLVIADQENFGEGCLALKHWYLLLDVLPRLKTLLIQFHNDRCPSMAILNLFVTHIKRTAHALFSCCIDDTADAPNKRHFINCLEERIHLQCSSVQFSYIGPTRLDAWM